MGDTTPAAPTLTTGRPLDEHGEPAGGPVLELDPDGRPAALLRQSSRALVASPSTETWATLLEVPESGATDRPVLLQWLGPEAPEPPVHRHPASETFEAVDGPLTVQIDGQTRSLDPGDSVTVDAGVEHTFRNDTDGTVAFRAELPSMRTVASLYTVWALDHEGKLGADGQPGVTRALPLSADVYPDTTMTDVPVSLQRILWATVGNGLRLLGYAGIEERYLDDEFWHRHVEQPQF